MASTTPIQQSGRSTLHKPCLPKSGPVWLKTLREIAFNRLSSIGFPNKQWEEWRLLDVSPITERDYAFALEEEVLTHDDFERLAAFSPSRYRFVLVNGRIHSSPSDGHRLPPGVRVLDLAEDMVQEHLGQYADHEHEPFTALNTAMIEDTICLHIAKGVTIDQPIHLQHVTVPQDQAIVTNPRILVVSDESSQVTIVEDYITSGGGHYFTNAVTEFVVGPNAMATHYMLNHESLQAFNISTLQIQQMRNSRFTSHSVLFGGAIVRNNINAVLAGEGCDSLLNGLYVPSGDQVVDNHIRVDHTEPHCNSRQFYKGIMRDHSRGMFRGRIIVRPDAQKTDAVQSNNNLLLSEDASIHSDPQLEIYADDVKCTHGSTTGQMEEEAIFYLRSRGISEQTARSMLIHAFANDSLERIRSETIRARLAQELSARLI